MDKIFISIASYRDPELERTVRDCISKANKPDRLFFSIVSQADEEEHPDLSFVNSENINYVRLPWESSLGVCWARSIAMNNMIGEFYLQIDSHSRFISGWDELIINSFLSSSEKWGKRIILTNYPDPYDTAGDGKDILTSSNIPKKFFPVWDDSTKMIQASKDWPPVEDLIYGDEVLFLSANSLFTTISVMEELPYDQSLYFTGEEFTMAIRAYSRGIVLVAPTCKFMFTKYNRDSVPRRFHWQDHAYWWRLNSASYDRIKSIISGDDLGSFGIGSMDLFDKYQKVSGINISAKYNIV